jgi:hypothetical protein
MSVAEAVQTFVGIANENEFYSHHYLADVFKGDIKSLLDAWVAREEQEEGYRAPNHQLKAAARGWFAAREALQQLKDPQACLKAFVRLQAELLAALGFTLQPSQWEGVPGHPVPVWQVFNDRQQGPRLLLVPAFSPAQRDEDPLEQELTAHHYNGLPVPKPLQGLTMAEVVSEALFGAEHAPRFVLLVGKDQWLLLDRFKWPNNRVLRFDWTEILDRKDSPTLQATAALLHKDSLAPEGGSSLLDTLDESAHKNAFAVSEDLKYALREAIELIGNEAARQLIQFKDISYTGKSALDAEQLSIECLRMVYRLLFMFYIEARPELGYVPILKSDTYLKGYSLESLRDLERIPLNTPQARDGLYFDASLRQLFSLIANGTPHGYPARPVGQQRAGRLCDGAPGQPPVRPGRDSLAEPGEAAQLGMATGHPEHVPVQGTQRQAWPGQLPAALHQPAGRRLRGTALLPGIFCPGRPLRSPARAKEGQRH